MVTNKEILERHAKEARPRARMELTIVHKLIQTAADSGYTLTEREAGKVDDLLDLLFNLDEAVLEVHDGEKRLGFVYLVFGNDGFDLISDYSTSLEDFLKPCMELADMLEQGLA